MSEEDQKEMDKRALLALMERADRQLLDLANELALLTGLESDVADQALAAIDRAAAEVHRVAVRLRRGARE